MKKIIFVNIFSVFLVAACAHSSPIAAITIAPEDQICQQDSDCTNVLTNCKAVSCECYGTPINQIHSDKYAAMLNTCQKENRAEHQLFQCDIDCTNTPRLQDKCVEGRCQLIERKANLK